MALGDLIYNQPLPEMIPFSIGSGMTCLPGQFVITGFGKGNFESGYFDITNNLDFTGTLAIPEAFNSIQYNEEDNTYWGLAPYVDTGFPNPNDIFVYHFNSDGTAISAFNVRAAIPVADLLGGLGVALSLSIDGSEVLVAWSNSKRLYRFTLVGDYLGYVDFVSNDTYINGISRDGSYLWICTTNYSFPVEFTIAKTDNLFNVLDLFTEIVPTRVDALGDIEWDKYNFSPECAIVIRGVSGDSGNRGMYVFGYEVPCPGQEPCEEPPVIDVANQCLPKDSDFDPLERVTATDCDGTDITYLVEVIENNVDMSQVGMYTITYGVTSPTNQKNTTKMIYVGVFEVSARQQAITDLIESVALEQTAIAHVLNAEGEKIQKLNERDLSETERNQVTRSLTDMLQAIAQLELVLQGKLQLFQCDICQPECIFPNQ